MARTMALIATPQLIPPIKTIFITSSGYTGTHWIVRAMDALTFNGLNVHEPYPSVAGLGNAVYRNEISQEEAKSVFYTTRKSLVQAVRLKLRRVHYLEANQDLALLIPTIKLCFNKAIIVGMIRNGRHFVESAMERSMYAYCKPWWLYPIDGSIPGWSTWTRVMRLSWYWATKTRAVVKDSHIVVRFDGLFNTDYNEAYNSFKSIMDFIRIPWSQDITTFMTIHGKKSNSSGVILGSMKWTPAEDAVFDKYCGPLMKELHYDY